MAIKTDRELIEEMHDRLERIYTSLFGVPDTANGGLLESFKSLTTDYCTFKRNAYILFGFLVGSGILAGSILGVLK